MKIIEIQCSIMKAIQARCEKTAQRSDLENFNNNDTQNEISNYYVDEARDWCLHKFPPEGFSTDLPPKSGHLEC